MKRTIHLIWANFAVLAAFSSCQTSVEIESQQVQAPEIIATLESGDNTKSMISVDSEGLGTIYWTPSDRINIFYGTTSTLYTSQNSENALTAVFRTTDIIGSTESASENIWGLYPYNEDAVCDGTAVTTTIPSTQYAVPDTFDDDLFPTLAHSETNALKFYNVCGGIKFSLSRDDITQITFRGNDSEDLAGQVRLSFTNNVPAATVLSGEKEITLLPKAGSTFAKNTNYYMVLLPRMLSRGFTITFNTSGGYVGVMLYTEKSVLISRSVFSRKAEIDSYASFFIPTQIQFDDNEFKSYCVQNFDTNSDGEVDTYEASLVSSMTIGGTVSSLTGIHSFINLENLDLKFYYSSTNAFYLCGLQSLKSLTWDARGPLVSLYAQNNPSLIGLGCISGCIDYIDVSGDKSLTDLVCYGGISALNLRTNTTALESLTLQGCHLYSLDVSNNPNLKNLYCTGSCYFQSLDVSNNPNLKNLYCTGNSSLREIWLKTGQTISNFQYDTNTTTIKYKD